MSKGKDVKIEQQIILELQSQLNKVFQMYQMEMRRTSGVYGKLGARISKKFLIQQKGDKKKGGFILDTLEDVVKNINKKIERDDQKISYEEYKYIADEYQDMFTSQKKLEKALEPAAYSMAITYFMNNLCFPNPSLEGSYSLSSVEKKDLEKKLKTIFKEDPILAKLSLKTNIQNSGSKELKEMKEYLLENYSSIVGEEYKLQGERYVSLDKEKISKITKFADNSEVLREVNEIKNAIEEDGFSKQYQNKVIRNILNEIDAEDIDITYFRENRQRICRPYKVIATLQKKGVELGDKTKGYMVEAIKNQLESNPDFVNTDINKLADEIAPRLLSSQTKFSKLRKAFNRQAISVKQDKVQSALDGAVAKMKIDQEREVSRIVEDISINMLNEGPAHGVDEFKYGEGLLSNLEEDLVKNTPKPKIGTMKDALEVYATSKQKSKKVRGEMPSFSAPIESTDSKSNTVKTQPVIDGGNAPAEQQGSQPHQDNNQDYITPSLSDDKVKERRVQASNAQKVIPQMADIINKLPNLDSASKASMLDLTYQAINNLNNPVSINDDQIKKLTESMKKFAKEAEKEKSSEIFIKKFNEAIAPTIEFLSKSPDENAWKKDWKQGFADLLDESDSESSISSSSPESQSTGQSVSESGVESRQSDDSMHSVGRDAQTFSGNKSKLSEYDSSYSESPSANIIKSGQELTPEALVKFRSRISLDDSPHDEQSQQLSDSPIAASKNSAIAAENSPAVSEVQQLADYEYKGAKSGGMHKSHELGGMYKKNGDIYLIKRDIKKLENDIGEYASAKLFEVLSPGVGCQIDLVKVAEGSDKKQYRGQTFLASKFFNNNFQDLFKYLGAKDVLGREYKKRGQGLAAQESLLGTSFVKEGLSKKNEAGIYVVQDYEKGVVTSLLLGDFSIHSGNCGIEEVKENGKLQGKVKFRRFDFGAAMRDFSPEIMPYKKITNRLGQSKNYFKRDHPKERIFSEAFSDELKRQSEVDLRPVIAQIWQDIESNYDETEKNKFIKRLGNLQGNTPQEKLQNAMKSRQESLKHMAMEIDMHLAVEKYKDQELTNKIFEIANRDLDYAKNIILYPEKMQMADGLSNKELGNLRSALEDMRLIERINESKAPHEDLASRVYEAIKSKNPKIAKAEEANMAILAKVAKKSLGNMLSVYGSLSEEEKANYAETIADASKGSLGYFSNKLKEGRLQGVMTEKYVDLHKVSSESAKNKPIADINDPEFLAKHQEKKKQWGEAKKALIEACDSYGAGPESHAEAYKKHINHHMRDMPAAKLLSGEDMASVIYDKLKFEGGEKAVQELMQRANLAPDNNAKSKIAEVYKDQVSHSIKNLDPKPKSVSSEAGAHANSNVQSPSISRSGSGVKKGTSKGP